MFYFKICSQLFSYFCCYHHSIEEQEHINANEEEDALEEYDADTQNCALNTIVCYSKFTNDIRDCTNKIYRSSVAMTSICDSIIYSFKYLHAFILCKRILPMQSMWLRMSVVRFYHTYEYDCKYQFFNDNAMINSAKLYDELSKNQRPVVSKPWYSIQCMNEYNQMFMVSRIYRHNLRFDATFEKSAVRFLLVEYTHPEMKERVQLEIEPYWYIVGNELFSFTMVMHLLEHQHEPYVFDKNYTLSIMDQYIETRELKYNESILLGKRNVQIMKV
jgi:hypothetical protein